MARLLKDGTYKPAPSAAKLCSHVRPIQFERSPQGDKC